MNAVPACELHNGVAIPRLGFGTWMLNEKEAEEAVSSAFRVGYRLIDTAATYENEVGVARAIAASGIPRDELFITTKVRGRDHGYESTLRAFDESVKKLGLDYVDLYLIHWPMPEKQLAVDTWRALITLHNDGRVRAIGVSNFKQTHIDDLIEKTGVIPLVNQVELHPEVSRPGIRAYDTAHNIVTESWGPLGRGAHRGVSLTSPVINAIAQKYGKTNAQVILRWHMELGLIAIPKSAQPQRIIENIDIFDFSLTIDDLDEIAQLDRGDKGAVDSDLVHYE